MKKYEWLEFAQSYLLLAKLACQELADTRTGKHTCITRFDPEVSSLVYRPTDLFVPIIFNVKHGIEVFTKTLSLIHVGNYDGKSHDIEKLFQTLKKSIGKKKLQPFTDSHGNIVTQVDIDDLPRKLELLEKIILKYFHCDFLTQGKKMVEINDFQNDVFRYPDNKAEVKIGP
jgi:hypothetical protein